MKRSLFLAAVATLAGTSAMAQSTVNIYGRLNVSAERQKQVGDESIWAVQDSSSRIGFKGTEDLGGGLKASFLIESGFSTDTGAASANFWGRESWVGLEGGFGRVRMGNVGYGTAAYFATADYISMHNHDTGTSADAFYLYPAGPLRNVIAYNTPTLGGLSGEVQVGLKESNAAGARNSVVVAGNYVGGPLHLGASYVSANQTLDLTGFGGPALAGKGAEFGLRALYEMGPVTLGAYYINNKIKDTGAGDLKRNAYRLSAMYTLGASELHANFGVAGELKVGGTTVDDTDAKQFTLGYNYNLSKRTKVYTFYTKLSGDGAEDFYAANVGGAKSSFAVGVRHNF